jgi:hypothetical protein
MQALYEVPIEWAELLGWSKKRLSEEISIPYKNLVRWPGRKSADSVEYEKIWKGLGISPVQLFTAMGLSDEFLSIETERFRNTSRAMLSPVLSWALQKHSLEQLESMIARRNNLVMKAYLTELAGFGEM